MAQKKSGKMTLKEKEAVIDEIYIEQPALLASILVQKQMGNTLEQMDVLINILLVAHLALKEDGVKLVKVSELEQDKEMAKYVGHVRFSEGLSGEVEAEAIQQYIDSHDEKLLLSFAYNEMVRSGFADLKYENSKYLIMAGMNIVSCIAAAEVL